MTDEKKHRLKRLLFIGLVPVVLGLPFVHRAFFVDDHYHVLMAEGILEHPSRPYDFRADDAGPDHVGWERGAPPRMVNPPMHHAVLAFFLRLGGGHVDFARFGFLLLAGGSAVFVFLIAQYLYVTALPATLIAVLTPVFWLTSYSLLIDGTMFFFGVAGLWGWLAGLRRDSARLLSLGAFFLGLSLLTKYTGAIFFLMALLWWWMQKRSWRDLVRATYLLIPVLMMVLWSVWTARVYGAPHILAASRRAVHPVGWPQLIVFLSFFSGSFLFPVFSWRFILKTSRRVFIYGVAFVAAGTVLLAGPGGGFSFLSAFLISFFVVSSVVFFLDLVFMLKGLRPEDKFLFLWMVLGSAQMMMTVGWVASRYYLTLLVPAAFLCWRRIEKLHPFSIVGKNRYKTLIASVLLVSSGSLAVSDYFQAQTARLIIRDTRRDGWLKDGARGFFLGDSFTDSYLKEAGWIPAFRETVLRRGDLILKRDVIMPRWEYALSPYRFQHVKTYEYPASFPLHVMDNRGSAGFYASVWGALPFSFSREPWERYRLLQVVEAPEP
ncbi:MAG TPA: glycosyltransferase family 39 protein [Elusimicrobiota bacterium]|nr:glycosyltransferase family 39 protein [Elusimicrobiota bacterium]